MAQRSSAAPVTRSWPASGPPTPGSAGPAQPGPLRRRTWAGQGRASLTTAPAPHPIGTGLTVATRTAAPLPNQARRPLLLWQQRPGNGRTPPPPEVARNGAGTDGPRTPVPGPQVTTRGWGARSPPAAQCGDVAGSSGDRPGRDGGVQRLAGPGAAAGRPRVRALFVRAAGPPTGGRPEEHPPPSRRLFACTVLLWRSGTGTLVQGLAARGAVPLSFVFCQGEGCRFGLKSWQCGCWNPLLLRSRGVKKEEIILGCP